jgi:hypothetical protein
MGSVQRIAHKIRGISRVLFLELLFCDSFGASGFIDFFQPWRGINGDNSATISPAHMRVRAWMTPTVI